MESKERPIYYRSVAMIAVVLTLSSSQAAEVKHVVGITEYHAAIVDSRVARGANEAVIERFFSEPKVNAVLASSGFSSERLIAHVMTLSDADLARLAGKIRPVEADVRAGELKDAQVTLIIMAVAAFAFLSVLVLAFK